MKLTGLIVVLLAISSGVCAADAIERADLLPDSVLSTPSLSSSPETNSQLNIVTSIRPLSLIVQDALGKSARLSVLVPPTLSPHDYMLKASDVKVLYEADLVVWLGPQLEQFLVKPMSNLSEKRVLTLNKGPENNESHSSHEHDDAEAHSWLDPIRAGSIALAVLNKVAQISPAQEPVLREREKGLADYYNLLTERMDEKFAPVKNIGFIVYHPGYDALVERFGLKQIGWVTISPEQPPGLRHLLDLEKTVVQARTRAPVKCLFIESGHDNPAAEEIGERLGLQVIALDILGSANTLTTYAAMLDELADKMVSCLSD